MIKKTVLAILVFSLVLMGLFATGEGTETPENTTDTTDELTVTLNVTEKFEVGFTTKNIGTEETTLSESLFSGDVELASDNLIYGDADGEKLYASVNTNQGYRTIVTIAWNDLVGKEPSNTIPLSVTTTATRGPVASTLPEDISAVHSFTIQEVEGTEIKARKYSYPLAISVTQEAYNAAPSDDYTASVWMILSTNG